MATKVVKPVNKPTGTSKPVAKTAVKPAAKQSAKPIVKPAPKPVIPAAKPKPKGDVAKPVSKSRKGDSIAMFIDIDSTNASATNVLEIISILKNYGYLSYGKLYGYTDEKKADFGEIIDENRLETAGRLRFKTDGTSVIDTRLVLESVTLTQKNCFDSVFIWAGVGELTPLFERLRELDAKTLTVDLPDFDCKNKFVSQAIKLFSPHSFTQTRPRFESEPAVSAFDVQSTVREPKVSEHPEPAPKPAPLASPEPKLPKVPGIDFENAPQLPRKKGAPGFGTAPGEAAEQEEAMDPEEYRKMLLSSAATALNRVRSESQIKDEFGSVGVGGFDDVKAPEPESKPEPVPEPKFEPASEPAAAIDNFGDDAPWLKPESASESISEPKSMTNVTRSGTLVMPDASHDSAGDAPWLKPETEEEKMPKIEEETENKKEKNKREFEPLSATEAERLYNTQDESKKYGEETKKHNYDEGKTVAVSTYDEPETVDTTFTDFGDFGDLGNPGEK